MKNTSAFLAVAVRAGLSLLIAICFFGTDARAQCAVTGSTFTVCEGSTITLGADTCTVTSWTSGNTSIATVSSIGVVTGVAAGSVLISYTGPGGTHSATVTVQAALPATTSSTGSFSVCAGNTITLSDATTGGVWRTTNTAVHLDSVTGAVRGISATTATILYVYGACSISSTVFVVARPNTITAVTRDSVCVGATVTFSETSTGGTWSSSDGALATVGSTGIITGVSAGIATISYTNSSTGCFNTKAVTVMALPPSITGGSAVCVGALLTLSDAGGDTTWSSGSTSIATISTSGVVHGVAAGTATITFTVPPIGCYTTTTITVDTPVSAGFITGATVVCAGANITLTDTTHGGIWSSSDNTLATVSSTGVVHGLVTGSVTISYTRTNGCGTYVATYAVSVNPIPDAGTITGISSVCAGSLLTLSDAATGGTWSSTNTAIATVNSSGVVTALTAGSDTIKYTVTNACHTSVAFLVITVNSLPSVGVITGAGTVCAGSSIILTDLATGGTWSSTSTAIATVSSTGVVYGLAAGTVTISYTATNGCGTLAATHTVTVNALPVVSAGPDRLICTGLGVTLHVAIGGDTTGVPGYTYAWSPGTGLSSTTSHNPMALPFSTTTYVVTVTNSATGCHNTDTVTVAVIVGSCSPCADFGSHSFSLLGVSGDIHSNVAAGNYYIPNSVTITGDVTFTAAVIEIAAGASITVQHGSILRLRGCHLFSCSSSMWNGIVLDNSADTMGVLELTNDGNDHSTLIEDAYKAVSVMSASTPVLRTGSNYFLTSDNTIFNRNVTGIDIEGFNTQNSGSAIDTLSYPFRIVNTVFTSRDLSLFSLSSLDYPYNWPNTTGTYGLKTAYDPSISDPVKGPYMAPFNCINPHAGPATTAYPSGVPYPGSLCHTGGYARIGIYLDQMGTGDTPYTNVVIGDTPLIYTVNKQQNLFDTLQMGIASYYSNLVVRNCAFVNSNNQPFYYVPGWTDPGWGIYAYSYVSQKRRLAVEPAVSQGGADTFANAFYNCNTAIFSKSYYQMKAYNSNIISTFNGQNAFFIRDRRFDTIDIQRNTITNMNIGVWLNTVDTTPYTYIDPPGLVMINHNTFKAKTTPASTYAGALMYGVEVSNTMGSYATATNNIIMVDTNKMQGVFAGIELYNIGDQMATSNGNTIYLTSDTDGYGIQHHNCVNNQTRFNSVIGTSYTYPMLGIISNSCTNHLVACNFVSNVGRGIQFTNGHLGSTFRGNTMNNCGKGFVLNASSIGMQGNWTLPSNNQWTATGGFSWNIPGRVQTYTEFGSVPTASTLEVSHYSITDPVKNDQTAHICSLRYGCVYSSAGGSGNGLSISYGSITFPVECVGPEKLHPTLPGNVAAGNIGTTWHHKLQSWTGQNILWETMTRDSSLADSTTELSTFFSMAANSRYALFTTIESYLSAGDFGSAQLLLDTYGLDDLVDTLTDPTGVVMADSVGADTIVGNYRNYYQMYIHLLQGTFDATDSVMLDTLAHACPITHGAIVYKARALYDQITNTLTNFKDNCDFISDAYDSSFVDTTYIMDSTIIDTMGNKAGNSGNTVAYGNGLQQYQLHPNPNNGTFVIHQYMADNDAVSAEVYDAIGRVVYKADVKFTNPELSLTLKNAPPGMYLLKLRDSQGRNFTFKFMLQ